jgi:hypothetical protein
MKKSTIINEGIWSRITSWVTDKIGGKLDEKKFADGLADLLLQAYKYNPAAFVYYNPYDITFYPTEGTTGSYAVVKLPDKRKYYVANPKKGISIEIPIYNKLDNVMKYICYLEKNKITPEELKTQMNFKKSQHGKIKQALKTNMNITPAMQENFKLTKSYLKQLIKEVIEETRKDSGKCPEDGCVQKKPNGKWGVISNKTGKFWDADYDTKADAEAGLRAYHVHKG